MRGPPPEITHRPEAALDEVLATLADSTADDDAVVEVVQRAVEAGLAQSDPRLVRALLPHAHRLSGAPGLKTLKAQLRDVLREPAPRPEPAGPPPVPEAWPLREFTSGLRVVIVGGDPRPTATERIKDTFGFASVLWEENDNRRVLGLADRVRGGSVDMILALRGFMEHADSHKLRPACKAHGVPFCLVDNGYGVAQVRLAIERFCSDRSDDLTD